jgi:hypothetical protein
MSTNTKVAPISQENALALCQQIRAENANQFWSTVAWQCWGCMKFSKGNPAKMCFSNAPDNRGCQWVNQRYDQSMRAAASRQG